MTRARQSSLELVAPDRYALLQAGLPFRGLNSEELRPLAEAARWRTVPAGAVLFLEGDEGHEMYVVGAGTVLLQKETAEGPKFLASRGKGDAIGEMSVFDGRPRSATGICETECLVLALRKHDFVAFVRKHPSVALGIIGQLMDRLRESDERATDEATLDVLGKLARYLLNEGRLEGDQLWLLPKPSDRAIGERIGCRRETVNRKLSDLAEMGILARKKGGLVVLDENRLAALGNEA